MKSTPEEREERKRIRRASRLPELVQRVDGACARGREAISEVNQVLERSEAFMDHPVLLGIRLAN